MMLIRMKQYFQSLINTIIDESPDNKTLRPRSIYPS